MLKIAVVGSSLISALMVRRLARAHFVEVWESGPLGGAWSEKELGGQRYPSFSNLVVPQTSDDDGLMDDVDAELRTLGSATKIHHQQLDLPGIGHSATRFLTGSFFPAIRSSLGSENVRIKRNQAKRINLENDKVAINGIIYDHVFITPNTKLETLVVDNQEVSLEYSHRVSQHVRALLEHHSHEEFRLEITGDRFDRASVVNYPQSALFVGRVAEPFKGSEPELLLRESPFIQELGVRVRNYDVCIFSNSRLTETSMAHAVSRLRGTSCTIMDTHDFIRAYKSIVEGKPLAFIEKHI